MEKPPQTQVRVFRRDKYKVRSNTVYQAAEIPLKSFPGGINTDLLKKVRESPGLSIDDFIHWVLGGSRVCNRIKKPLVRYAKRGKITPEMLCLVDPYEWVCVRGFGKIAAKTLFEGIKRYRNTDRLLADL